MNFNSIAGDSTQAQPVLSGVTDVTFPALNLIQPSKYFKVSLG